MLAWHPAKAALKPSKGFLPESAEAREIPALLSSCSSSSRVADIWRFALSSSSCYCQNMVLSFRCKRCSSHADAQQVIDACPGH